MAYPVSYRFSNTSLKPIIITLVIVCRAQSALAERDYPLIHSRKVNVVATASSPVVTFNTSC